MIVGTEISKFNETTESYDALYPTTSSNLIYRSEDPRTLEQDLKEYDSHITNSINHVHHGISGGTHRELTVTIPDSILIDQYLLLLVLSDSLEYSPTLSFNDGDPKYIVNANGDRIPGGQIAGSSILISWSESADQWTLLSTDAYSDITTVILPVETEYNYVADHDDVSLIVIPDYNSTEDKLVVNYNQTILRKDIDYFNEPYVDSEIRLNFTIDTGDTIVFTIIKYITTSQRGHFKYDLVDTDYPINITVDGTTLIDLPDEAIDAHSVVVNYNQTVLRNGIDYSYNDLHTAINLLTFSLDSGETIVFTITKFVETTETKVPNNWGTTGNYRYSVNVKYSAYTAGENNVSIIAVPQFNFKSDSIFVIKNNQLYVSNVDYRIDEVGQVVLLKTVLNQGDIIYFTILEGAMVDVPNYNTIIADGIDGQDILFNMSYTELTDFYTILVKLKYDLIPSPTIKCIDGPAEPIYDIHDNPLNISAIADTFIFVVYNYGKHRWYFTGNTDAIVGNLSASASLPNTEYKLYTGTDNFIGQTDDLTNNELAIQKIIDLPEEIIVNNLNIISTQITPSEPPTPNTTIGDIWSYINDKNKLCVGNSGTSTSKFKWTITCEVTQVV